MIERFYTEKIIGICSCGAVNVVKNVRYAISGNVTESGYKLVDVWRCPICRHFNHSVYYPNFEKLFEKSFIGAWQK